MTSSNFEAALALVLKHEGGYADHPADPGGATNLGITHITLAAWRATPVTKADMRALTRAEAAAIYRERYWNRVRADDWPAGMDLALFDYAVNSGPARAVKAVQKILGVAADGIVGPVTLGAARGADAVRLVRDLSAQRLGFLQALRHFPVFGRGWTRRVSETEAAALDLAKKSATVKENIDVLTGTRTIFRSRTLWGALTAMLAQGAAFAGVPIPMEVQESVVEIALQLIGIVGAAIALWGSIGSNRGTR